MRPLDIEEHNDPRKPHIPLEWTWEGELRWRAVLIYRAEARRAREDRDAIMRQEAALRAMPWALVRECDGAVLARGPNLRSLDLSIAPGCICVNLLESGAPIPRAQ